MARRLALLLVLVTGLVLFTTLRMAQAVPVSTPTRTPDCFGLLGIQFATKDAYLCEGKLGDDPSGSLYFMVTLGNSVTGKQVNWYKLHPASGNLWVYETLTPQQDASEQRDFGRTVQIDEGKLGQCLVAFPSWTVTPTECAFVTDGGARTGAYHRFDDQEADSMAEFGRVMRGLGIPWSAR